MFVLNEKLDADTGFVIDWPVSTVRLMNDSRYPWLILVPRVSGVRDLHHLVHGDLLQVTEEIATASKALETLFSPDKINVGALGNIVPQLHIHVIARQTTDDAWPGPVWGAHPPRAYGASEMSVVLDRVRAALVQDFA